MKRKSPARGDGGTGPGQDGVARGVRKVNAGSRDGQPSPPPPKPRAAPRRAVAARDAAPASPEVYDLKLYVAGQTSRSISALANLKRLCEEHLPGRYRIEVIDLAKHPHLARADQVLAIPTLVRSLPEPVKKIIGDLSDTERAVIGLDIRPVDSTR